MRFVEIKTPKPAFARIGNSRRRANGCGPWRSSPPMKLVATSRPYAGDAGCGLPGRPDGHVADRTGQQARERRSFNHRADPTVDKCRVARWHFVNRRTDNMEYPAAASVSMASR